MNTCWQPRLITPNTFGRDVLLGKDFDPINHIPEGHEAPLLDDDWGVWILRQPDGERVRRSLSREDWHKALATISKEEFENLPFSQAIKTLNDEEILHLYHFIKEHHLIAVDHLVAIRAILVPDGAWIWCVGICHDAILVLSGYDKLLARFRNQRAFLPRIEYEPEANIAQSLMSLLEQGFELDDKIDIGRERFRAMSISDALEQLGSHI